MILKVIDYGLEADQLEFNDFEIIKGDVEKMLKTSSSNTANPLSFTKSISNYYKRRWINMVEIKRHDDISSLRDTNFDIVLQEILDYYSNQNGAVIFTLLPYEDENCRNVLEHLSFVTFTGRLNSDLDAYLMVYNNDVTGNRLISRND